ncbi:hypothetical protein GWI33_002304 [Rhynchophorus ferrugineus]|uniref:Sine oculis-binding protein-like protein n=1 Tax=Rhynchophorus ferrugineus TaxID=354439 RepID=A0A834MGE8_RHYFE|nr:hypothetical protein GWI33_002304 [Rhynchophorus ferrugineus]
MFMEKRLSNEVTITKITVKKEKPEKEFAETAMNELLGWYGYETSRSDVKVPTNCRSYSGSNDSEGESLKFNEGCGWCGKPVEENNGIVSAASVFCSELCFSQSRRANFKRNKTCDWCRHVRHTVSYVDFQDGASQLQFCSDKCLNQYKMHIFCRETRAHLELHPHLHGDDPTSGNLITPDLWLRNCKSPTNRSPSPKDICPKPTDIPASKQLPLITLTPNIKLLSSEARKCRLRPQKKSRKRCPSTVTSIECPPSFNDTPQDLRVRHTPPIGEIETKTDMKEEASNVESSETTENPEGATKISPTCIKAILGNLLPPPTVFVPYPVILPLPIPIPIPIPIPKMFKTNNDRDIIELKETSTQTELDNELTDTTNVINDMNDTKTPEQLVRRPLRKRKRIAENRNKLVPKHKKTFSSTL